MGVATAEAITEKLIADGLSPDTPVAVMERATRADARYLRTLLTDMADLIAREGVQSPALLVIGDVANMGRAEDRLPIIQFANQKIRENAQ